MVGAECPLPTIVFFTGNWSEMNLGHKCTIKINEKRVVKNEADLIQTLAISNGYL